MKTKTKIVALLALGAIAASALLRAADAPATPPPPPTTPPADGDHGPRWDNQKRREHRMQVLEEKLQLTAAQKQQILAIWDQAEQQGKALRDSAVQDRDALRQKRMEIMKASHDQVRAVLTPDQQKTFDALPPEGPGHRGHGPGAGGPPPPPPPAQ